MATLPTLDLAHDYMALKEQVATLESKLATMRERQEHDRHLLRGAGVRYGSKDHGQDGDAGVWWWAFPARLSDERIIETLTMAGVEVDGWTCHCGDYDCCGRVFARDVWIERKGSRALARQSWGRDV